jgi:hypothetical protein
VNWLIWGLDISQLVDLKLQIPNMISHLCLGLLHN